ncbi:MAG TPA: phosphatase PAP2 family protein [Chitinophagales bacterium]|nr:phosphatase PAP2 family protein [Chitinophagales bacterium]
MFPLFLLRWTKSIPIFIVLICSAFFSLYSQAQNADTYNADVLVKYHDFALKLIRVTPGFTPPVASRALGYIGLGSYESIVQGIPTYQTADGVLLGLGPNAITDPVGTDYHYPTVANNALVYLVDSLFANMSTANRTALYNLRDSLNTVYQSQTTPTKYSNSVTWGGAIGVDVFNYSKTDGGHKGYTTNFPASYTPPTGLGLWEPTPVAFQPIPLQPYWGNNRPFVAADNTTEVPTALPLPFSDVVGSPFYNYAKQVYDVGNALTTEQNNIALYWADGGGTVTPPGHSVSMLTQQIVANNNNLAFATLAYAKLDMAMTDAFINCWKTKYTYNLLRPVTYIQDYINPTWLPSIATPPFPEFTSGHSTQSGAFAAVMESLYGPAYSFTDNTNGTNFGGSRSFANFDAAAAEAAVSRLYGGIHYEFSNDKGVDVGNNIGNNINELFATQLRTSATADVSLQMAISQSQANVGGQVVVSVYLVNDGMTALDNVQIQVNLADSLQFVSATPELGTYNTSTGIWTIPHIDAGVAVVELQLLATIIGDGIPTSTAEVIAMTGTDADSTPNNQNVAEDDQATICMSVPVVMCNINVTLDAPAGYTEYQWYKSTDNGLTYQPYATTQSVTITEVGYYTVGVNGAILGSCGDQLCCPLIVEQNCCPAPKCVTIGFVKH